MPAIVNANLFRIASDFVSKEETRYYLKGVLIQRHQLKGVNLVATCGEAMIVIHDEHGETSLDDVIVRLDKNALAACKPVKGEPCERKIRVEGDGEAVVYNGLESPSMVAVSHKSIIDGCFPYWQRVVPNMSDDRSFGCFNPKLLTLFAKAAESLEGSKKAGISISSAGPSNPALIRFPTADNAFGVLMSRKAHFDGNAFPWFLSAAPASNNVKAA